MYCMIGNFHEGYIFHKSRAIHKNYNRKILLPTASKSHFNAAIPQILLQQKPVSECDSYCSSQSGNRVRQTNKPDGGARLRVKVITSKKGLGTKLLYTNCASVSPHVQRAKIAVFLWRQF